MIQAQVQQIDRWAAAYRAPRSTPFDGVVGSSPAMQRVMHAIEQVAPTDATVLLSGETGTGKELVANAVHVLSMRSRGPLVKINCAAVPETLLPAELFGHEKGAFTGASDRRRGRFEQANGGTLFLDEIGELSASVQVMLLRVLQEQEFERLGSNQTVRVNVRVIAATNRDLSREVREGRFRSDLYYRINVFPVRLPALRERQADIPELLDFFVKKHCARLGKRIHRIDPDAVAILQRSEWPGNIREFENRIERAVILAQNGVLRMEEAAEDVAGPCVPASVRTVSYNETQAPSEKEAIQDALRLSRGKVSGDDGAARRLGMPASTLEFRIRRLGIDKYSYRSANLRADTEH